MDTSICWFVVRIFTSRCFSSVESRSLYTRNKFEYLACTSSQSVVESPSGFGPRVCSVVEVACSATPRTAGIRVIAAAEAASLAKCLRLSDSILFEDFCVSEGRCARRGTFDRDSFAGAYGWGLGAAALHLESRGG